jgi:membrane-associated phospholipid phosphatase
VVTALLGAWITHQTSLDGLDVTVDTKAQAALGEHPRLLDVLIWPGGPVAVTAMTVALALAWAAQPRYRKVALVVISVPAAIMITELLLKPLVGRHMWSTLSFPAGTTTGVFALAAAVTVLLIGRPGAAMSGELRLLLALTAFLMAALVPIALIARGLHYFTDGVAGTATSIGAVLLTALLLDLLWPVTQRFLSARHSPVI